jgi:hypothetical protein
MTPILSAPGLGIACLLVVFGLACSGEDRGAPVAPSDTTASSRSEPPLPKPGAEDAAQAPEESAAVEIPDDFPKDVPFYPDAVATTVKPIRDRGMTVTWVSEDDPRTIASFYQTNLAGEGWEIEGEAEFQGQHMLRASKDGRLASILVMSAQGDTHLGISIVTQPK